ncbi:hypothetical protein WJX81_008226 [Elliptochloris bilobata]|uniref:Molybdopterin synthase sulfur carrier subunit n=1 Tax=Elliptochloris bilobata TaxID=381761 RepID=A0AAW1R021_9CHLO
MKVNVLFFARSREIAGVSETVLELKAGATSQDLLESLLREYPLLKEITGSCVLALNQEYLAQDEAKALRDGDEVAVIPPISGG